MAAIYVLHIGQMRWLLQHVLQQIRCLHGRINASTTLSMHTLHVMLLLSCSLTIFSFAKSCDMLATSSLIVGISLMHALSISFLLLSTKPDVPPTAPSSGNTAAMISQPCSSILNIVSNSESVVKEYSENIYDMFYNTGVLNEYIVIEHVFKTTYFCQQVKLAQPALLYLHHVTVSTGQLLQR